MKYKVRDNRLNLGNCIIGEAEDLDESEKEAYFHHNKDMIGKIHVASFISTITNYLVHNPNFELNKCHLDDDGKTIIYVDGYLPLSCLRYKTLSSESMNYLSRIISYKDN